MNSNEEFSAVESRDPDLILPETQSLHCNEQTTDDEDLNLLSKENDKSRGQYEDEKNNDISLIGIFLDKDDDIHQSQEMDVSDLAFNSMFDKDVDVMEGPTSMRHEDDNSMEQIQFRFLFYLLIFGFISLLLVVNVYAHLRFSMHPEISWNGTGEIDLLSSSECQKVLGSLSGSSTCNPCNGGLSKFVCYPSYIFMH